MRFNAKAFDVANRRDANDGEDLVLVLALQQHDPFQWGSFGHNLGRCMY